VKEIPDHFGPVAEGSMALPEFQVYRLPGLKTINSFTKTPLLYCFLFFLMSSVRVFAGFKL